MTEAPRFLAAFPYQEDVLALPVADIDSAAEWYCRHFGMTEFSRSDQPVPSVILERDGVQIGFAINGGDAAQDGAAIEVNQIEQLMLELKSNGVNVGDSRIDERDGTKYQVFFAIAPDGLCYYFHQPIEQD